MDMNKTFFLKKEARKPSWKKVDATDKVLGRLATDIANMLRGKDEAIYTPHTDAGDYVVVTNAAKVRLTGNKWNTKVYRHHTGWIGGLKEATAKDVRAKDATQPIYLAVKGMLPKTKLARQMLSKLRIYAGDEHPHVQCK